MNTAHFWGYGQVPTEGAFLGDKNRLKFHPVTIFLFLKFCGSTSMAVLHSQQWLASAGDHKTGEPAGANRQPGVNGRD